jgi:drug/metabolite transporter (DMT)-like permease
MMLYAGVGSLVFSFAANFVPNFQLHLTIGNYHSGIPTLALEICLGFCTMIANGLLVLANRLSSPTINSVIRRSEILLVLGYDVIFLKEYPDAIESCGYIIVILSVIGITFSDAIQELISKDRNKRSTTEIYML